MNDAVQDEPLLGTSTLRGILLLGGVATVAYLAYQFWYKTKKNEMALPQRPKTIRIPIELPIAKPRKK